MVCFTYNDGDGAIQPTKGDNLMQAYSEHQPTGFDAKGAFLPDQQDWLLVPVSRTRDTGDHEYSLSNFLIVEAELDKIDPERTDHEVASFNHWGPGWYEIILVRPGTPCQVYGDTIEARLEDYPVLDEEDWCTREFEAACEAWEYLSLSERVEAIQGSSECTASIFAARSGGFPQDMTYESDAGGIYFR